MRLGVVSLLAVALLAATAHTAGGAGGNGRLIAYVQDDDSAQPDRRILELPAEGGAPRDITPAGFTTLGGQLAWSPDGRRLAFAGVGPGDTYSSIWTIAADGSGLRELTHDGNPDGAPSWSPDGRSLAFISARDGGQDLYRVGADGTHERRLTHFRTQCAHPDWGRSGWIVVQCDVGSFGDLVLVRPEGARWRFLRHDGDSSAQPAWSPNGRLVAYNRGRGIAAVDLRGRIVRQLVAFGAGPTWSPDGRRIAYSVAQSDSHFDLYVAGRRVTTTVGIDEWAAAWQP